MRLQPLGTIVLGLAMCANLEASFWGSCMVGIQRAISSQRLKKPLLLTENLDLYFSTEDIPRFYGYKFAEDVKTEGTKFRGMILTREELENIQQNGLDPNLSARNKIFFGSVKDALFYAGSELKDHQRDGKDRIRVLVQLTPEWSDKVPPDDYQPAYYTQSWIPPQGIQSIFAINPRSKDNYELSEITQRQN